MRSGAQQYIPDSPGPLMVLPFHSSSSLAFVKPHVLRQFPGEKRGWEKATESSLADRKPQGV